MTTENITCLSGRCEKITRFCAVLVATLSAIVLFDWFWNLSTPDDRLHDLVVMRAESALAFLFAAIALLAISRSQTHPRLRALMFSSAGITTLLGLFALSNVIHGKLPALDQFFHSTGAIVSAHMLPTTALLVTLTGLALLLNGFPRLLPLSRLLALCVGLAGLLAVIVHAYSGVSLNGLAPDFPVTPHTAAALLLINLGVLLARPAPGMMTILNSDASGGLLTRRLMPFILVLPLLIGLLHIISEEVGLYTGMFGDALTAITYMVLFSTVIWRTAVKLNDNEQRRVAAEQASNQQQAQMAGIISTAMDAIISTDENFVIRVFNPAAEMIFGYKSEEIVGCSVERLIPARFHPSHAAHMRKFAVDGMTKRNLHSQTELSAVRADGSEFPMEATISHAVISGNQVFTVILRDVSHRKSAEAEIRSLAYFDPLTQLPNRRLFMDRLSYTLANSSRSGKESGLLFLDLDHFKDLNDTLGHDYGDLLLQQVSDRLIASVREGDTVARFGGDEFVVMLENLSPHPLEAAAQTTAVGNKILHNLNHPFQLKEHSHHSTPSIGATLFNSPNHSVEELLKQADIALYQAKRDGRNCLRFFDHGMQHAINQRVELEEELRNAIAQGQFQLHYQIQVDSQRQPVGAEALIRWNHPTRGMVEPDEFIPLADETGLILPMGLWVLESACAQLRRWEQSATTRMLVLSVNVSAKQFRQKDFVPQLIGMLERHALSPSRLKLELTESMLLENVGDTIAAMQTLSDIGIQFSLDDFGTGYSSLQYLKQLPLDQLKIDRSFVRDIVQDSNDLAIVHTIIGMAHSMELDIIAEGVESEAQRALLLARGCETFQGYLFGKPLPADEFEAALEP